MKYLSPLNSRYGINLTDEDKVNIDTVRQKIFEDEHLDPVDRLLKICENDFSKKIAQF